MRRGSVAVVTSVSTVVLGAGWAAGLIGAAMSADPGAISLADTGGASQNSTAPAASATASSATDGASAPASAAASPAPAAPVVAETPAGVSGTFDGALARTGEGNFQAQLVIADGVITQVNVLVGGDNRGDSVRINQRALPMLQERVLAAQSANVEGISGASYTVQGFLASVNDAMAQAGLA